MKKQPKIKSISTASHQNGALSIIGLGDDGKVYYWLCEQGKWLLNHVPPAPVKP